jgi:hypothetical protein
MKSDSVCLRNVALRAKLVPVSSDAVFSPSLGPFLANSEWAFVAKRGKRVPSLDFFLSSSLSIEVLGEREREGVGGGGTCMWSNNHDSPSLVNNW